MTAARGALGEARRIAAAVAERDGRLRALVTLNPHLESDAARLDDERAVGRVRSRLHGLPVVVKDNIVVGASATAGSLALLGARHPGESPLVARLRDAGALLVGSATLSEWAGMRSTAAPPGWNAVRGQARNPLDASRSPWGSSSGSAIALAAGFARIALGTDTSGSALLPAAATGTYALRPTPGRLPIAGTVPISPRQDAVAPMAATLDELEQLYRVLAPAAAASGSPPRAPALPDRPVTVAVLGGAFADYPAELLDALDETVALLARRGVVRREIRLAADDGYLDPDLDLELLLHEFGPAADAYLRGVVVEDHCLDLATVVQRTAEEQAPVGQDLLETALQRLRTPDEPARVRELALVTDARRRLAGALHDAGADALVTVTASWPPRLDDHAAAPTRISTIPGALAGWPQLSLPARTRGALPAGILLLAPPGAEELLFRLARIAATP